jgi:hypothetical protein
MKRWLGWSLLLFSVLSTGCVDRYRYRDDYYGHHYDHGYYDNYRR